MVGSLPTSNGSAATAESGCLIVLDSSGHVLQTISGPPINGPWDMTAVASGQNATLFLTNVLNGTVANGETVTNEGTVARIRLHTSDRRAPKVTSMSVIATGFPERTDPAALVVGPTGVALGEEGTLYVADTQGNRIAAVPGALNRATPVGEGGTTVAKGGYLNNPLGLTLAPNGDILTANADDGNLVETTPVGAEFQPFDTKPAKADCSAWSSLRRSRACTSSTTPTTRWGSHTERSRSPTGHPAPNRVPGSGRARPRRVVARASREG